VILLRQKDTYIRGGYTVNECIMYSGLTSPYKISCVLCKR
jgi:hypothetical protein